MNTTLNVTSAKEFEIVYSTDASRRARLPRGGTRRQSHLVLCKHRMAAADGDCNRYGEARYRRSAISTSPTEIRGASAATSGMFSCIQAAAFRDDSSAPAASSNTLIETVLSSARTR